MPPQSGGTEWFTGAQDPPKEQIVFSEDGGATLSKPVVLSTGHAFGNTSLALADNGGAIVSWLERNAAGDAKLLVREVSASGTAGPVVQIAEGGKSAFGYPRVFHSAAGTFIAYGSAGKLQTAQLSK